MDHERPVDMDELWEDGTFIDEAMRRGVREALLRHKKLGQWVVVERDGKPVRIPPEEIPEFD